MAARAVLRYKQPHEISRSASTKGSVLGKSQEKSIKKLRGDRKQWLSQKRQSTRGTDYMLSWLGCRKSITRCRSRATRVKRSSVSLVFSNVMTRRQWNEKKLLKRSARQPTR